jgi:hypothetical protein
MRSAKPDQMETLELGIYKAGDVAESIKCDGRSTIELLAG